MSRGDWKEPFLVFNHYSLSFLGYFPYLEGLAELCLLFQIDFSLWSFLCFSQTLTVLHLIHEGLSHCQTSPVFKKKERKEWRNEHEWMIPGHFGVEELHISENGDSSHQTPLRQLTYEKKERWPVKTWIIVWNKNPAWSSREEIKKMFYIAL